MEDRKQPKANQILNNESVQNQLQEQELSSAEPDMVQGDVTSGGPGEVPNETRINDAPNGSPQQNRACSIESIV